MWFLHHYIITWLLLGAIALKTVPGTGGWLIMITDSRNTYHTWLTWPALLLCWVFWPIGPWVARQMFMLAWRLNVYDNIRKIGR